MATKKARSQAFLHIHTCTHTQARTHTRTYACMHTHIHAHTHTHSSRFHRWELMEPSVREGRIDGGRGKREYVVNKETFA